MDDPGADIAPGSPLRVLVVVANDGQGQSYREEGCRLLVEMIVIISDLSDMNWDFGVHVLFAFVWVR